MQSCGRGWILSQLTLGEKQGTPRTSYQFSTGQLRTRATRKLLYLHTICVISDLNHFNKTHIYSNFPYKFWFLCWVFKVHFVGKCHAYLSREKCFNVLLLRGNRQRGLTKVQAQLIFLKDVFSPIIPSFWRKKKTTFNVRDTNVHFMLTHVKHKLINCSKNSSLMNHPHFKSLFSLCCFYVFFAF